MYDIKSLRFAPPPQKKKTEKRMVHLPHSPLPIYPIVPTSRLVCDKLETHCYSGCGVDFNYI